MGQHDPALRLAAANIQAWTREIEGGGLDAIAINASGCGTTVKDYGFMFRNDPALRDSVIADLQLYLQDDMQSWALQPDGSYRRVSPPGGGSVCAQQILLERYTGTAMT